MILGKFQHLLLCVFFSISAHAADNSGSVDWNRILNGENGSDISFGVEIAGPSPFRRSADSKFMPASTSKLFTSGAALAILGKDFRFTTKLQWTEIDIDTADNIILIGGGDPTWGVSEFNETLTSRLDSFAKALFEKGVRNINGEITLQSSDPRWDIFRVPDGWQSDDLNACYGALAQGFNLNLNCSGADAEPRFKTSELALFASPIKNTKPWIKDLFVAALKRAGIKFIADNRKGSKSTRELQFYSPPLGTILKPFMKNSINFIGDALIKKMGEEKGSKLAPDLLTAGLELMANYLRDLNLANDIKIFDGSGISHASATTPHAMALFLEALKRSPDFSFIWDALPIAGVDGTLSNRMKNSPAQGVLRAKTGTLSGVYNLSGYVPSGGDFLPFVVLTSTNSSHAVEARAAEDRVGIALTKIARKKNEFTPEYIPFPYIPEHAGLDAQ